MKANVYRFPCSNTTVFAEKEQSKGRTLPPHARAIFARIGVIENVYYMKFIFALENPPPCLIYASMPMMVDGGCETTGGVCIALQTHHTL